MAVKVTDILKQVLTDQLRRTISGQEAVRRILDEVRRQVIMEIATAQPESFTLYRQTQMLGQIERLMFDAEAELRVEASKGITDSWNSGKGLITEMALAGSDITLATGISSQVLDQIKEFTWGRISSVRSDAVAKIRAEITLGLLGQKTPQEISSVIAGTLESPGLFKGITERAEVITKTEMGRAFSMAHQASLVSATEMLPDLQKMWLHAGHPKQPRPYHLRLNGDIKAVDQPFLIGSVIMMYPRDPKGPIGEIINCGCMHVAYMRSWGTKAEFTKAWAQAQRAANTKQ